MQLWPKLADWFGLDVAPPLRIPLSQFMPHHKELWASIVKKHNLKDIPFEKVPRSPHSCYEKAATVDRGVRKMRTPLLVLRLRLNGLRLLSLHIFTG